MAMALNRFTQWLWPANSARSTATHELPTAGLTSAAFPDFPSGFREPDTVTFATAGARRRRRHGRRRSSSSRDEEEARVDKEFDMVIVPSDGGGGCLSGSESDDSDWAIGWQEKLSPELQTDGDPDSCFAVLVRCYRHGQPEPAARPAGHFLAAGGLSDGRNFV
uniref:Uncharacterized protein n=1 Tax=Leersia perrieri TaxID=77586 RepID=A0A0D9XD73_9ORYZ